MKKRQIIFNGNPLCDLEYKVKWESLSGRFATEWLTEFEARKKYDQLKNEILLHTIWAELLYAPIDDEAEDEVFVIDSFTRPTITISGHTVIIGK